MPSQPGYVTPGKVVVISTELLTQVAGCTEMTVIPVYLILSEIHDDRRLHDVYEVVVVTKHAVSTPSGVFNFIFYCFRCLFCHWGFIATSLCVNRSKNCDKTTFSVTM